MRSHWMKTPCKGERYHVQREWRVIHLVTLLPMFIRKSILWSDQRFTTACTSSECMLLFNVVFKQLMLSCALFPHAFTCTCPVVKNTFWNNTIQFNSTITRLFHCIFKMFWQRMTFSHSNRTFHCERPLPVSYRAPISVSADVDLFKRGRRPPASLQLSVPPVRSERFWAGLRKDVVQLCGFTFIDAQHLHLGFWVA